MILQPQAQRHVHTPQNGHVQRAFVTPGETAPVDYACTAPLSLQLMPRHFAPTRLDLVAVAPLETVASAPETEVGSLPTHFTRKAVESYYLTTDASGHKALSEVGKAFYARVKEQCLDSVPKAPIGSPTLYFTGGLPGSGKSSILDKMWDKDRPEFVRADSDQIKQDLLRDLVDKNPDLKAQMEGDPNWQSAVQDTSYLLVKQLMHDAIASGKDVVYDSVMASPRGDHRQMASDARKEGYQISGIVSQVDVDTAVRRASQREHVPVTVPTTRGFNLTVAGRKVDESYIDVAALNLKTNLRNYLDEGLFDKLTVYDNNADGQAPRLKATYERIPSPAGGYSSRLESGTLI